MKRSPSALIIADDFTGACDTGVQFARPDRPVLVRVAGAAVESPVVESPDRSVVSVSDTESRHAAEDVAAARVRDALREAVGPTRGVLPRLVYKKIDSTLRGNIARELAALREALPGRIVVIAPAFPRAGRTTVDGVCLVDGVPVHETEFGRDPFAPVRTSLVGRVAVPGDSVAVVSPTTLGEYLAAAVAPTAIVVDATTDDDLADIAATLEPRLDGLIVVGSAGLAGALGEAVYGAAVSAPVGDAPGGRRLRLPVLAVVGSLSSRSSEQVMRLRERRDLHVLEVASAPVPGSLDEVVDAFGSGRSVLLMTPREAREGDAAHRMSAELARVAATVVGRVDRVGLVLTGGETAVATLRAAALTRLLVHAELEPGVPLLTAETAGGREIPMITKAGGFGTEFTLVRAFECLEEGRCLQ